MRIENIDYVFLVIAVLLMALAATFVMERRHREHSKPVTTPDGVADLVPPDLIEPPQPRIRDLPIGGSTYTFFGYHVASDLSVWIDPEELQEKHPSLGQTSRMRVTLQADGYHVHILGAVKGTGRDTPRYFAALGYVRAVEVTH